MLLVRAQSKVSCLHFFSFARISSEEKKTALSVNAQEHTSRRKKRTNQFHGQSFGHFFSRFDDFHWTPDYFCEPAEETCTHMHMHTHKHTRTHAHTHAHAHTHTHVPEAGEERTIRERRRERRESPFGMDTRHACALASTRTRTQACMLMHAMCMESSVWMHPPRKHTRNPLQNTP